MTTKCTIELKLKCMSLILENNFWRGSYMALSLSHLLLVLLSLSMTSCGGNQGTIILIEDTCAIKFVKRSWNWNTSL